MKKEKILGWIGAGSGFFVLGLMGVISLLFLYESKAKQEVKNYKTGVFQMKLPICYDASQMPKTPMGWKSWEFYVIKAANGLNEKLKAETNKGPFFIKKNKTCTKDRTYKFVQAPKIEEKWPSGNCQSLPWKVQGNYDFAIDKTIAWINHVSQEIQVCTKKLEQAYHIAFQNNSIARKMRNLGGSHLEGRVVAFRHELAHILLHQHLFWAGGLMLPSPKTSNLNKWEVQIIKEKILPFVFFVPHK